MGCGGVTTASTGVLDPSRTRRAVHLRHRQLERRLRTEVGRGCARPIVAVIVVVAVGVTVVAVRGARPIRRYLIEGPAESLIRLPRHTVEAPFIGEYAPIFIKRASGAGEPVRDSRRGRYPRRRASERESSLRRSPGVRWGGGRRALYRATETIAYGDRDRRP